MASDLYLRERNRNWFMKLLRGETTVEGICAWDGVSRWTVARGVADAATYREVLRNPEVQAWARSRGVTLFATAN